MSRAHSITLPIMAACIGVAFVVAPLIHAKAYGLTVIDAQAPGSVSGVKPAWLDYTPGSLAYLREVGIGPEYGSPTHVPHRWTEDLRIKVYGTPTDTDLFTLRQVVDELNTLVDTIKLEVTDGEANLDIYFLPESQFASLEPKYVPVNLGFFRVWWDHTGEIKGGRILIASEGITQRERSHLIREELTQSLGVFKDSWRYPDSIFYQGWTDTIEYSELDRAIIRLLYASPPGASRSGRDRASIAGVL